MSSTPPLLTRFTHKLLHLSAKQCSVLLLVFLCVSLAVCLIKWVFVPIIIEKVVWATMALEDGTQGYEVWISPPVPVYTKFYFFNVLNPDSILQGGKPEVEEVGPFTYSEYRQKEDVYRHQGRITYSNKVTYEFNKELSCPECREDTQVTVVNGPLLGAVGLIRSYNLPPVLEELVLNIIEKGISANSGSYPDHLFHTVTAGDLLFSGYTPGIISWVRQLYQEAAAAGLGPILPPLPDAMESGKFSFWGDRNGTKKDQVYTVDTGAVFPERYAAVTHYNSKTSLPHSWWDDMGPTPSAHTHGVKGECKYIRGTDGQQFHPMLESGEVLWLFEPDLCRSIAVTQVREVDIGGINTHHYEAGKEVFSMENPNNYCYCPKAASCARPDNKTDSWDLSTCSHCMDGVFSTLGCQGAAAYGSAPHFLSADPSLRDAVTGLNPNSELHTTYLNVEPLSGIAFQAHKKIQVSFPLEPIEKITILQQVSKVLLPVLWYDEGADITDEYISDYYRLVQLPLLLVNVVTILSLISSFLVLVLVLANCVRHYRE